MITPYLFYHNYFLCNLYIYHTNFSKINQFKLIRQSRNWNNLEFITSHYSYLYCPPFSSSTLLIRRNWHPSLNSQDHRASILLILWFLRPNKCSIWLLYTSIQIPKRNLLPLSCRQLNSHPNQYSNLSCNQSCWCNPLLSYYCTWFKSRCHSWLPKPIIFLSISPRSLTWLMFWKLWG